MGTEQIWGLIALAVLGSIPMIVLGWIAWIISKQQRQDRKWIDEEFRKRGLSK